MNSSLLNNTLTIFNLLTFNTTVLTEIEKELFGFDQNMIQQFMDKLDKGYFYLGGQIKMNHNDLISLEDIEKVRVINKNREIEYGGPCNSFEAASINTSKKELEFIENMIIKYNIIMNNRENSKLKME